MQSFKVVVAKEDRRKTFKISVTGNGYQWTTIGELTKEQLEQVGKECLRVAKKVDGDGNGDK